MKIVIRRLLTYLAWLLPAVLAVAQSSAPATTDPESLIKEVAANQKQLEIARKNYIFHRRDQYRAEFRFIR